MRAFIQLTPEERRAARAILKKDRAIALGQLARRLGLLNRARTLYPQTERLEPALELAFRRARFCTVMHRINRTKNARRVHDVVFVCINQRVAGFSGWNLRQLSGLSAMREHLSTTASVQFTWNLMALNRTNTPNAAIPDARLFVIDSATVWVAEWDSGSHVSSELQRKALAYRAWGYQLWASPSEARSSSIRRALAAVLPSDAFCVMTLEWW